MNYLTEFANFLREKGHSPLTVKNYLSDIRSFLYWLQNRFSQISLDTISPQIIQIYLNDLKQHDAPTSFSRKLSSLRKFTEFLLDKKVLVSNPLPMQKNKVEGNEEALLKLREFAFFLKENHAALLTIKNYSYDVKQFFDWLFRVTDCQNDLEKRQTCFSRINSQVLKEYQERLRYEKRMSLSSIERKLSALRQYFIFASKYGLIDSNISSSLNLSSDNTPLRKVEENEYKKLLEANELSLEAKPKNYSSFPPLRLLQRISKVIESITDELIAKPLADIIVICQNILWRIGGSKIFFLHQKHKIQPKLEAQIIPVSSERFFAPLPSSIAKKPFFKKLILTLRFTRPHWYRKYHSYTFVHYLHFGILALVAVIFGSIAYERAFFQPKQNILGAKVSTGPGRLIIYQGKLTHTTGSIINERIPLRFSIYNSPTASGSALLWQEVQEVLPAADGSFTLRIGSSRPIPEVLFTSGTPLFLGVTVKQQDELKPREAIPNVALAESANNIRGMIPITQEDAKAQNVLLALDSAGNLTIANSSPIFQATGGNFTLRANALILTTLPGSNGNIVLNPDGHGIIDINKTLQNTSEYGKSPLGSGGIEIADTLAVLSTSSAIPALAIINDGGSSLIVASSSGSKRFLVDNSGNGFFAGSLIINGTDLGTEQYSLNLFNRYAGILNIGGEAEAITIGSSSGTTRIRNATTALSGNLTIAGTNGLVFSGDDAGIFFSGGMNHKITALSGKLLLGSELQLAKDVSIVPETTDGTNNLGLLDRPFDNLYVNNITFTGISTNINQLNGGNIIFQTSPEGSDKLKTKMVMTNTGNLGIGITNPNFRLQVIDEKPSSSVAMIANSDIGSSADVLSLKVGTLTPGATNSFITFLKGNDDVVGRISGNGAFISGGEDFAEYFKKHDQTEYFEEGHLVCIHPQGGVTKCSPSSGAIIGVVTNSPAFVGGASHENDPRYILVGISGQLPVRIVNENGELKPSDPLTYSSIPGVATKALSASYIVGNALTESISGGKILSYIRPAWYEPNKIVFDAKGSLTNTTQSNSFAAESIEHTQETKSNFEDVLSVVRELKTSLENIPKSAWLIREKIMAAFIAVENLFVTQKLISPLAEIEYLHTRVISPLSADDGLSLVLLNDSINIAPVSATSSALVRFDRNGNATISGNLSANSASLAGSIKSDSLTVNEATIEGTLRVNRLVADSIESPSATRSTYITNVTNVYQFPNSTDQTLDQINKQVNKEELISPDFTNYQLKPPTDNLLSNVDDKLVASSFIDLASSSGHMLSINFLTIREGIISLGPASLTQLSLSDKLSIGNNFVLEEGGINVIGKDLTLQSLRQGNLSIMGGLITIDTNGNLRVGGDATFARDLKVKGSLFTSLVKPIPEEDLVVELSNSSIKSKDDPKFIIHDSSKSAVFQINNLGEVVASGSGSFLKLITDSLKIIRGAQADTSITQTIASASAGTATIIKGQKQRTIVTPYVTESSLIYLTPTSDTKGLTPYVAKQTPNDTVQNNIGSFTIELTSPAPSDINVNWWIIN